MKMPACAWRESVDLETSDRIVARLSLPEADVTCSCPKLK